MSRPNALSPISSLPPELLAPIFIIVCLPGASSQDSDGKPDYNIARLSVSHVCHQWREIALNLPLLWSHADFTSESLSSVGTAEMLIRAKSSPLDLEAANISRERWDKNRLSTFRKALQAHVPHIRHLIISAESVLLHKILEGLVLSPAPTLEDLSLSCTRRGKRMRRMEEWSSIPDTLFNSFIPRLCRLELRGCNIRWSSPLLKGVKHLEILNPSVIARPELTVWLAALDEMPQLMTLSLHSASPYAPFPPFVIERTVTLPSLTHLDILDSPKDSALAIAHLDLPALTCLRFTTFSHHHLINRDIQELLPFIVQHAHGPQDTQPLQSVLICSEDYRIDIHASPVPNIGIEVHDLPTTLTTTLPARVALSFRSDRPRPVDRFDTPEIMMAHLPLDGLVMLAIHDSTSSAHVETQRFWHHLSPMWPLLQCVQLTPVVADGFVVMLLGDHGGCERPLLPSLKKIVMVDFSLYWLSLLPLYDALRKRVEQGVPVETLDLRMCRAHADSRAEDWLQSLREFVVDVLRPEQTSDVREQIESM
jgi:hypothetical protein